MREGKDETKKEIESKKNYKIYLGRRDEMRTTVKDKGVVNTVKSFL